MKAAAAQLALALALAGARIAAADPVMQSEDDPHPGIHHEHWADASLPAEIDLVRVDLTNSELALYATPQSDRGMTTSSYAETTGAQVAINGDAFAVAGFVPRGLAMGDSEPWSGTADDTISAVFDLRRAGERTLADIVPPEVVVTPDTLPAGTQGVVSGEPLLVRAGVVESGFDCTDQIAIPCEPAPRSAVGLTADGNTMLLVVVDGWQSASIGMTAAQLASFLASQGADAAIALDSGGSSTLVLDDAIVNHPSNGVEADVANQISVQFGSLPQGQLVGLVCKHDVIGCTDDATRWIAGATVTLDDGRMQVTPGSPSTPLYDFDGVTPRLACVTVKADGYLTVHQCQNVVSGQITYNSVAMFEGTDPPDAGLVADGPPPVDASPPPSEGPDAGVSRTTAGPGGCCDAGGSGPAGWLLVTVAWFLMRRRGKFDAV